jgi:hypothetical protein
MHAIVMKSRFLSFFLVLMLFAVRAAGAGLDLKPPQVTVTFIFPPSPLIQDGTARLVYEMVVTNYVAIAYTLESIGVEYANRQVSFSGESLKPMIRFAGEPASTPPSLKIEGGRTAVVFLMLQFENPSQIPASLEHTLRLRSPDGMVHALAAKPLEVQERAPVIVEAPLRGSDWIAGDSVHNGPDAAHRRAILFADGEAYVAQRYAIDWVRYRIVNGVGTTWSGAEDRNSSYFCYGAPIYSMTSGTVTDVLDGIPENVPHSGKMAIDVNFRNAGGNHVVIYAGYGLYAFYAHMRPGTIKVKVGDHVSAGETLGEVGNSGNSTEPHLHEHIVNRPSFLAGQGVPYEFAHFEASGPVDLIAGPHQEMYFKNIGTRKSFTDDYPAANAVVSFD